MSDEPCYHHAAKCYDGPPADAIRDSAREPGMSQWFDEVRIPPQLLERGDVVVWRKGSGHAALALGDEDKIYQKGVDPGILKDFVYYRQLRENRQKLTKKERKDLKDFEKNAKFASRFSVESFARAGDMSTKDVFGAYTVYRLKPEFEEEYYTCKQLEDVPEGRVPHIRDGRPCWCGSTNIHGEELSELPQHIMDGLCWCGRKGIHGGQPRRAGSPGRRAGGGTANA